MADVELLEKTGRPRSTSWFGRTTFEDLIHEVGGYGRLQRMLMWLFLIPASISFPFTTMVVVFQLATPEYKCNSHLLLNGSWSLSEDQCTMWSEDDTEKQLGIPCTSFNFSTDAFDETIATQWNLVCDKRHWTTLIYTVGSIGCAVGTPIFGFLADHIGRKPTFYITVIFSFVSNSISLATSNLYVFTFSRFINGVIFPSIYQLPYIIVLEIVGPSQRTFMLASSSIGWTIGLCFLPLVAYYARHWFTLLIISTCCAAPLFFYWKLIPESPRWLLSMGRVDDAVQVLKRIAKFNRATPPSNLKQCLERVQQQEKKKHDKKFSHLDLYRTPRLRRHVLIVTLAWCACMASYDIVHINAENLSGNQFLTFFLLAIVEFPSYAVTWYLMENWGRRWSMVLFLAVTAISCVVATASILFAWSGIVGVVCAIFIKFAIASAYMVTYQQAAELFPTPLRNSGLSSATAISAIFACICPFIVSLNLYGAWIPFVFLGIICSISGISSMFVPETLNYPLCQTLQEAQTFGMDQKFWSFNLIKPHESKKIPKDEVDRF